MQLIPKTLIKNFGGAHFKNARSVMFHPQDCEALDALAKVMSTGYVSFQYNWSKEMKDLVVNA